MTATRFRLAIASIVIAGMGFHALAQETRPAKRQAGSSQKTPAGKENTKRKPRRESAEKAKQRANALRAIVASLGLGEGSSIADIGSGGGRDTWVFAEIVGPTGAVYAEEIAEDKIKTVQQEVEKRGLSHVHPTLGRDDSPCLPADTADMAFMHYVYHHVSKPREMLRAIWQSLKPGGYFVVVDRHLGTLQDWVPREERAKKHYWLAETTVVREAREEGFTFVRAAEDCWPAEDQFVLYFQRPKGKTTPGSDPDAFLPLPLKQTQKLFAPVSNSFQQPVFIALGEARQLIAPILQNSSGAGLDVVLEEWATQKEERPPLPAGVSLPSALTENGDPHFDVEPSNAVFFLDTYHLLFHHETLLAKIHDKLSDNGRVYILDRKAQKPLSRREASHRRKISTDMVKQEMEAAGFQLQSELRPPAADRFLFVFTKAN